MNEIDLVLAPFVDNFRSNAIPPPHILLIGSDAGKCEAIARSFAERLAIEFRMADGSKIETTGDLTACVWGKSIAFISNINLIKKPLLEKLTNGIADGAISVIIGQGPAARTHKMGIEDVVVVATAPSKYGCPAYLTKAFEVKIHVDPPNDDELIEILSNEAWKERISLDRDASELLIRAANRQTSVMLGYFSRISSVIPQIKQTNKPQINRQEVENALTRLRIKIPAPVPAGAVVDIQSLSGEEFEAVVKSLLVEMGFEAELTEITGDGGIDIIAKLDRPFVGGRYLFQCKRYTTGNMVGSSEVRDFYGAVMADRAVKGIFITTSDFTGQAKDFAAQAGVELVNYYKLQEIFADHGFGRYR